MHTDRIIRLIILLINLTKIGKIKYNILEYIIVGKDLVHYNLKDSIFYIKHFYGNFSMELDFIERNFIRDNSLKNFIIHRK